MGKPTRFVGLDVHAATIAVAVADGRQEVRSVGTVPNEPESVARLIRKLGGPEGLRVCYEAGPCGYGLYWQFVGLGVACEVVGPTLTQAVFDAIDTVDDNTLSYAELLAYYDNPATPGLTFLSTRGNGLLEITEVPLAFQTAAGGALVDADGDRKIDPAGYEVRTATGAAPIYITSSGDKILAATTGAVELRLEGVLDCACSMPVVGWDGGCNSR